MDILTYLIALSLTIASVVQTTGLFYKSDQKLQQIQQNFIEKTQKLHRNEKGSVTFVAITLVLLISAMLYFYVSKMSIEYKEAVYRKDSYLCQRFLNQKTRSYISQMSKFNTALRTAFAARHTVVGGVSGEAVFRGLVYARNARHFYYLKQLVNNKYCTSDNAASYLANLPFETTAAGPLVTHIDETTKVRKDQWTTVIYRNPSGIRLRKSFCLKTRFQVKNAFFPDLKMNSEEIPAEVTSSWKCLSGAQS